MITRRLLFLLFAALLVMQAHTEDYADEEDSSDDEEEDELPEEDKMYTLERLNKLNTIELTSKDFGKQIGDGSIWL